ncbi:MAG: DUF5309 domain-containing protein [Candidatus Peribacter sp.]|nr:DUF5309 domain-containing protein [Candidatus Peribacter sp.]
MSIVANTFTRYSSIGIREELSNVIKNISPEDTPFQSNIRSESVSNTYFEFQTDELSAAAANAQLDGDDIATFSAVTPSVRLGNYTQIMRKDFVLADNLEVINSAGRKSEIAYQLAKVGSELKRDVEYNLLSNQGQAAGSTTVARKTRGLPSWISTNVSKGTSGANATAATAARTDGTQRAMTEAMLKTVVQSMWNEGGKPKMVMVGPHVKTVISGFTGIAGQRFNVDGNKPGTIIGAADIYVSDFGNLEIVPNRFQRARDAFVLDPELCSVATLRPMKQVKLAKTGDAEKRMVLCEVGLKVDQEAGLGLIADLSTS